MTGPNNKSPARVATIVLLTCAVLLAFGDSSDKTDHYAALHKRGCGIFFGVGGTVFFGILAYGISLVLKIYSFGAGASARIGIFLIGAIDRSTSVDGIDY
ncbi:hypothetical protein V1520DRAFT_338666 [Lipomyces starkeyi]